MIARSIDVNVRVIECDSDMARVAPTGRPRGHIRQRGRSFQVIVYAGIDPVTGTPHRLSASTTNEKEAERILRRLIHEVEQQIHARTNATLSEALDAWLRVHAAEANTLAGYEANARRYIKWPHSGRCGCSS
jgi:integrase